VVHACRSIAAKVETGELLGCDIGGAKELGVIYFPTNWGAKQSSKSQGS